jgi:drug/metabolite transporter (DMT)-like permease
MAHSVSIDQADHRGCFSACAAALDSPLWNGLLLFSLGVSWGLQFTLLKVATDAQLGEFGILTVSMFFIAAFCLAALAWHRAWFWPARHHLRFFFLSGLFGFVLPLGGIVIAAGYLSAGLIVLFESLTPVFTVAIALLLRTESVTRARLTAVVLGVVSVLIAGGQHIALADSSHLVGLAIVLVVPLTYAIDGVYVAACWPSDLRAIQVVTGEAIMGAFIMLPFFFCSGEPLPLIQTWGVGHWALSAFVLVTLIEIFLYFYLLKTVGALYVSMASFLAMFSGIGWGMVLLGETHTPSVWLAVGLVSAALYIVTLKEFSINWSRFTSQWT